ncbi:MAG: hypothetical protein ACR2PT_17790 [Endozoicomonas sp.]
MKFNIKAGVFILLAMCLLGGCADYRGAWAKTTAKLEPFSDPDMGNGYKITYLAPESTAINDQDEPIKGPIDQYVTGIDKPVKAQSVQIRYQKDEPVFFELLSPLITE